MAAGSPGGAGAEIVDRIVANVNGSIILLSEVRGQLAALLDMKNRQGLDIPAEELTEPKVLAGMIDEKLVTSFAKERELDVKEAEVDKAIQGIKDRNKFNDEEFKNLLLSQGTSLAKFRERVKSQVLIQRVIGLEVDMVNPTEEEAKAYYDGHGDEFMGQGRARARHILILVPAKAGPEADAEAAGKIAQIRKDIAAGADFAAKARDLSDDPSRESGGEIGWIRAGEADPAFEKAMFGLEPGKISEPVRSRFGYHLIQVLEKETGLVPFAKVADLIKDKLTGREFEKSRAAWLTRMRDQAYIEILY